MDLIEHKLCCLLNPFLKADKNQTSSGHKSTNEQETVSNGTEEAYPKATDREAKLEQTCKRPNKINLGVKIPWDTKIPRVTPCSLTEQITLKITEANESLWRCKGNGEKN